MSGTEFVKKELTRERVGLVVLAIQEHRRIKLSRGDVLELCQCWMAAHPEPGKGIYHGIYHCSDHGGYGFHSDCRECQVARPPKDDDRLMDAVRKMCGRRG